VPTGLSRMITKVTKYPPWRASISLYDKRLFQSELARWLGDPAKFRRPENRERNPWCARKKRNCQSRKRQQLPLFAFAHARRRPIYTAPAQTSAEQTNTPHSPSLPLRIHLPRSIHHGGHRKACKLFFPTLQPKRRKLRTLRRLHTCNGARRLPLYRAGEGACALQQTHMSRK